MKAPNLSPLRVFIYVAIIMTSSCKFLREEYRFSATESAYFLNYTPPLDCTVGVEKDKGVLSGKWDKGHIKLYLQCYYDTGSICNKPADTLETMLKKIVSGFEKIMDNRERYDSVTITLTESKIINRKYYEITCKKSLSYALNRLQE